MQGLTKDSNDEQFLTPTKGSLIVGDKTHGGI
jgi:hypothetical protein